MDIDDNCQPECQRRGDRELPETGDSAVCSTNRQTPIAASLHFSHPGDAEVQAEFDWRQPGEPLWKIEIETDDEVRTLSFGAASMDIEYRRLYQRMAELVVNGTVDMDLSPLTHVADACLLGKRISTDPFFF